MTIYPGSPSGQPALSASFSLIKKPNDFVLSLARRCSTTKHISVTPTPNVRWFPLRQIQCYPTCSIALSCVRCMRLQWFRFENFACLWRWRTVQGCQTSQKQYTAMSSPDQLWFEYAVPDWLIFLCSNIFSYFASIDGSWEARLILGASHNPCRQWGTIYRTMLQVDVCSVAVPR